MASIDKLLFAMSGSQDACRHLQGLHCRCLLQAMLGVSLPLLRRVSFVESAFQRGLMSVLNCFAGGVFITFGTLSRLPLSSKWTFS